MSALATAEPTAATPAPRADQRVRIPARVLQAIELLETGECTTQKAAAARVGIGEQHLCRMLAREQVQVFIAQRRARSIAIGSLRASRRFVQLIDAESEHVAAKVCDRILTSEGVLKSDATQTTVNVGVSVGYVVKLKHVAADVATAAEQAQVIDNVEDGAS